MILSIRASDLATLPAVVVEKVIALVRKIMEAVSNFFWPPIPYHPSLEEKNIAGKVELLKRGLLKREVKRYSDQVPHASALTAIIKSENRNFFGLDPENLEVVFSSDIPLSRPVSALCEIGKQMLLIYKEKRTGEVVDPALVKFLQFADPLMEPCFELILKKIGSVMDRMDFPALFDRHVEMLSSETKALVEANRAFNIERRSQKDADKLARGKRVKFADKEKLVESHRQKIARVHPSLSAEKVLELAETEMYFDLYLRDFYTEQFVATSYCCYEVREIFKNRSGDVENLVNEDLHKMAEGLVMRFYPIIEEEINRKILPVVLGKGLVEGVSKKLPEYFNHYLKEEIVAKVASLLQKPISSHFWDEMLAFYILPRVQNQLLKLQFKRTIDADFEAYYPLLCSYSFDPDVDKNQLLRQVKKKLDDATPLIPLEAPRVEAVIQELLETLHEECYILRKLLKPHIGKPRGDFFLTQLLKLPDENANGQLLQSWQILVTGGVQKKGELAFCEYAQPLIDEIVDELKKRQKGELPIQLFRRTVEANPTPPNPLWGDIAWEMGFKFSEQATPVEKAVKPLDRLAAFAGVIRDVVSDTFKEKISVGPKEKVSELITNVLEPYRRSNFLALDQLVGLYLKNWGMERAKMENFLFAAHEPPPNLEKRLEEEIDLVAKLAYKLFDESVVPDLIPAWIPGKKWMAERASKPLLGADYTKIKTLARDILQGCFENAYVNLNRLHHIVDRIDESVYSCWTS